MKWRYLLIIALVGFISNCTHIREYSSFYEINSLAGNKEARLTLKNGQIFDVNGFRIAADSSYWLNSTTGKLSVSTSEIKSIAIKNSGRGALEGLGLGLAIGFGTGAIIGLASGNDEEGFLKFSAGEKALLGGLTFGVAGGLLGLFIGTAVESKDTFEINNGK